jgi:hypothetical protein
MSISFKSKDPESIAIAKESESKRIIYLNPEVDPAETTARTNLDGGTFKCALCGKVYSTYSGYTYHTTKVCNLKTLYDIATDNEINPLPTLKRQVIYIAGAQDSGKSYRVMQYIHFWRKLFPERKIVMISRLDHDETFSRSPHGDMEKCMIRMKPALSWLTQRFDLADFKDCLVVFDDIVSSNWDNTETNPKKCVANNKLIQAYIRDLCIDMVQNGRHHNTHVIITNHDLYDNQNTTKLLKDATDFIIFPSTTGSHHLNYFLRNYVGLLKKQIQKILAIRSRWILIHKNSPKYIMFDKGVFRYDIMGVGSDRVAERVE